MGFLAVGLPARGSFANAVHFAEGFLPEMVDMTVKSILADQPVWFAANSGE